MIIVMIFQFFWVQFTMTINEFASPRNDKLPMKLQEVNSDINVVCFENPFSLLMGCVINHDATFVLSM